jgi:hypothetical protein
MYPHRELPRIEVFHIADEYEYLDSALIELLTDKINSTLKLTYDLLRRSYLFSASKESIYRPPFNQQKCPSCDRNSGFII